MAEPGGAPGGADRVTELKVYSPVTKHQDMGRGSSKNGGTPTSMGHKCAFGNTEERLRLQNLGCAERGHPSQGPLDHATHGPRMGAGAAGPLRRRAQRQAQRR